jgi:ParB-like chromosome segregation protein Spo0J
LAECGAELPPILVHRETMRVVDGMHRLRAAVLRGQGEIEVRYLMGTDEELFVLAVRANVAHGLPLSLADRKAAAARILRAHPEWSDRSIARIVGLSDKTVGAARRCMTAEIPQQRRRLGRDGTARPVNTIDARRRAGELLAERPDASLREIGAATGLSTATVRDVRDRLRNGQDPAAPRKRQSLQETLTSGTPSSRPSSSRRRGGSADWRGQSKDPVAVLHALRADPALRLTESGRGVLRLLETCAVDADTQQRLAESIPAHCAPAVSYLVAEGVRAWQQLASLIRQRSEEIQSVPAS